MTTASLVINSPYDMPQQHWDQDTHGKVLNVVQGRREAAYELYDTRNNTRRVEPLETVNKIRQRVDEWRDAGWPGTTSISRQLLEHWHERGEWDAEATEWIGGPRQYPLYFCQLEAIECLVWWLEAPEPYRQGIFLPGDGGPWERICNKMATGSGKTTLMALIICWQTLNALHYPKDKRFSRAIFIVAPGLTVKSRLQVLLPGNDANVYDDFVLCPNESLRQKLNQVELIIENWHSLMPLKEPERSVVKKGKESDEAFTRRVLGKLAAHKDIVVLNDEAHHAYRVRPELKVSKKEAQEQGFDEDEATRWIEGLDRIHETRRIRRCFDLTATPFAPTGKSNTEKGLFEWIISDFGLNDAIEAGLVKTPRVVVRDDALPNAKTYASKLYHLYREDEVSDDLNRRAGTEEPLPDLVQKAYALLAYDWRETANDWRNGGHNIPPVLLTVCNRTETASRLEHFFNSGDCLISETRQPNATLRVDSKVLENAEKGENTSIKGIYDEKFKMLLRHSGLTAERITQIKGLKKTKELSARDRKAYALIDDATPDSGRRDELRSLKGEDQLVAIAEELGVSKAALEYVRKGVDYKQRLREIIEASPLAGMRKSDLLDEKPEIQLRALVDTVGKSGKPGQNLQNVISVAMLSEGWDAANVTHIMGLRAFTSQLLCEQVIGRGLRRVAYDMDADQRFLPEYVNVFGVPLSIFQDVEGGEPPPPPKPSVRVEVVLERNQFEIRWPNIERVQSVLKPELQMDWNEVEDLTLDPANTPLNAEIAPSLTGAPNIAQVAEIDLEKALEDFRLQNLIFRAARKLFLANEAAFGGDKQYLAVQLIQIVDAFLQSKKLNIPSLWHQDPVRRRLLFALNMDAVVTHVNRFVSEQNVEKLEALFDEHQPIGSTAYMRPWLTTKPCRPTEKSQISHVVYDSTWEKSAADVLEKDKSVVAWAKNDHLGFKVRYLWKGSSRNYVPDYLIRFANGKTLVLEIKGVDSEQNKAKRAAMAVWVRAVNQLQSFGTWEADVVFEPAKFRDVIASHY